MHKPFIASCLLYCISASALASPTAYITDSITISMRETPAKDSPGIGAAITTGTAVTILEARNDNGFTLIKTENGQKGWIPSQYLTDKPIARTELANLKQQITLVTEEAETLKKELERIKSLDTDEGKTALLEENKQLSFQLEELKKISANAIRLDQDNKELLQTNSLLKNDLDILNTDYQRLKDSAKSDQFMNGAYAVIIGVIITLLTARLWPKKRSEWG